MNLSSSQQEAIKHVDGPMLVLAGPGSGKTTVITERIRYLVDEADIDPSHILVITFTKAAAREMETRYIELTGRIGQRVTFGTFHAVFFRILKAAYNYNAGNIIGEDERYALIRSIIYANHLEVNDENEYISNALTEIGIVKSERIDLKTYYSINFSTEEFTTIYNAYTKALQSKRLIDYDDMMVYCYELLTARPDILSAWQKKYKYILIDEFQDINTLQYMIIRLLAAPEDNLFIVGDDDQSIYRFRGAKPSIMLGFPKDYPDCRKCLLSVNYRSTTNIIRAADKLIRHNSDRFEKVIEGHKEEGKPVEIYEYKDVVSESKAIIKILSDAVKQGESLSDFAIITRTNLQPGLLIHKLMEYNVSFISRDGIPNIYNHWIAKDIFAYIRIAQGGRDRGDFLRIINHPNRYVSRACFVKSTVSLHELVEYYQDKEYMVRRISDFMDQLGMIRSLSPYSAINFIYSGIGYKEYLAEYADYRHISADDLYEIYEEIMACAKAYRTYDEWFAYIEEYNRTITEKSRAAARADSVAITTMHGAKGLEYKNVIIPDVNEEIIPHKKAVLDADIEEERRMLYVAMTRARERLILMSVKDRYNKELEPSRFIEEIKNPPS